MPSLSFSISRNILDNQLCDVNSGRTKKIDVARAPIATNTEHAQLLANGCHKNYIICLQLVIPNSRRTHKYLTSCNRLVNKQNRNDT